MGWESNYSLVPSIASLCNRVLLIYFAKTQKCISISLFLNMVDVKREGVVQVGWAKEEGTIGEGVVHVMHTKEEGTTEKGVG